MHLDKSVIVIYNKNYVPKKSKLTYNLKQMKYLFICAGEALVGDANSGHGGAYVCVTL